MPQYNGSRFALLTPANSAPPAEPAERPQTQEPRRGSSGGVPCFTKIRRARPADAKFLSHLQKKFSNQLGFLPTKALAWYIENLRVGVALENGEPCGYVLGRERFRFCPLMRPITQTAVAMDAQRRHHGLALVQAICKQAIDAKQLAVQAVCAEDLEANDFWLAAGFEAIDVTAPENARGRKLIIWRKQLISTRPDWFNQVPPNAVDRPQNKRR